MSSSSSASVVRSYGKIDDDADLQAQYQDRRRARRRLCIIASCVLLLVVAAVCVAVGVAVRKSQQSSDGEASNDTNNPDSQLSTGLLAIQTACNTTAYPDVCNSTLANATGSLTANPLQLVIIAVNVTLRTFQDLYDLALNLSSSRGITTSELAAFHDCDELLDLVKDDLSEAIHGLRSLDLTSLSMSLQNVQIILSTASSEEAACIDGLSSASTSSDVHQFLQKLEYADKMLIDAVGLVNALVSLGSDLSSWKNAVKKGELPFGLHFRRRLLAVAEEEEEEEEDIPSWATATHRRLLQTASNTTVGSGIDMYVGPNRTFTNLTEALQTIPESYTNGERFVIYIDEGTYNEGPLNISKDHANLTLLGAGCGKTIITGRASVSGNNNVLNGLNVTTYRSATVGILAKGFIAKGITFRNDAGADGHQAVALRAAAEHFVFQSCCFEGYQDTLYALSGAQFYRDCTISGTVDFIFGDALAVFQNCNLVARQPNPFQQNTYTAQGKKDKDTTTGFSFQNCSLTPDPLLNVSQVQTYLGRPWKTYSTTVFLQSSIGSHVAPAGWLSWNQSRPFETTCVYGEYMNTGAGANISQRVNWTCVNSSMSKTDASRFTLSELFGDTSFIPSSVPMDSSL